MRKVGIYSIKNPENKINIGAGCYEKDGKYYNVNTNIEYSANDELRGDTADEILEFNADGDRLRHVIALIHDIVRII